MTKNELLIAISKDTGQPRQVVESCLNSLGNHAAASLQDGSDVTLTGLGKLTVKHRAERTGRNPQTGEAIQIAAKNVAGFKPSKTLADQIA